MSWSSAFDDLIPLPRGRQLVTLKDAAEFIQKLPKAEQDLEEWQAAVEALLLVVELDGPTMMARIGVMRALNRGYVREFDSSRKDTLWGEGRAEEGPMTTRSVLAKDRDATPSGPDCLESDLAKREFRQQLCRNIHSGA